MSHDHGVRHVLNNDDRGSRVSVSRTVPENSCTGVVIGILRDDGEVLGYGVLEARARVDVVIRNLAEMRDKVWPVQ